MRRRQQLIGRRPKLTAEQLYFLFDVMALRRALPSIATLAGTWGITVSGLRRLLRDRTRGKGYRQLLAARGVEHSAWVAAALEHAARIPGASQAHPRRIPGASRSSTGNTGKRRDGSRWIGCPMRASRIPQTQNLRHSAAMRAVQLNDLIELGW